MVEVVESLPVVFTTARFSRAHGETGSGGVLLTSVVDSGRVVKGAGDRWLRLPDPHSGRGLPHPLNTKPVLRVSYFDRLQALWGDQPRRLSHTSALAMAPSPVKTGMVVDAAGPPVDSDTAKRLGVMACPEPHDTMLIAARRLHGQTWVSTPARALLECLQDRNTTLYPDEAAARTLFYEAAPPATEAVAVAEQLGWRDPLRRLASIATAMRDHSADFARFCPQGLLPESQSQYLDVGPCGHTTEWIWLTGNCSQLPGYEPAYKDDKHGVLWGQHPHVLLEDLLR